MLARARLKLKNTESSIAFIQEQHTRTLEGLHQEIQQLQQKNARQLLTLPDALIHFLCAGLTFELAVQGTSAPKQGLNCQLAKLYRQRLFPQRPASMPTRFRPTRARFIHSRPHSLLAKKR